MKNWTVTFTNNNTLKINILEDDLTYNEARALAKEYNDECDYFIYKAERIK